MIAMTLALAADRCRENQGKEIYYHGESGKAGEGTPLGRSGHKGAVYGNSTNTGESVYSTVRSIRDIGKGKRSIFRKHRERTQKWDGKRRYQLEVYLCSKTKMICALHGGARFEGCAKSEGSKRE